MVKAFQFSLLSGKTNKLRWQKHIDIAWPCLLIIMNNLRPSRGARAANDTTRAQINNIPEKSHVIPLLKDGSLKTI